MPATLPPPANSAQEEISRLRQELAALRKAKEPKISFKVSPKGAISIYGLQRFPITLYREQWESVLSNADALRKFIADNSHLLASKGGASLT